MLKAVEMAKRKGGGRTELGLEFIGGAILALALWLVDMNVWTYAAGSVALAILVCVFVWRLPWKESRSGLVKALACVASTAVCATILIPQGYSRFSANEMSQTVGGPCSAPPGRGVVLIGGDFSHNGGDGIHAPEGENLQLNGTRAVGNKGHGINIVPCTPPEETR